MKILLSIAKWLRQEWYDLFTQMSVQSFNNYCNTGSGVDEWHAANPTLHIGSSADGRALIAAHIAAYKYMLKTNSFLPWNEDYIQRLGAQKNPPPHNSKPPSHKHPRPAGVSYI